MADISSIIALDAFVRRLLAKEDKDNDDYMRYMQMACDGLENMTTHDFSIEVTKVVTVDSTTNTFAYPSDYVRYTAIATPIDGRWWIFTRDKQIVPLEDDDGATITDSLPDVADYRMPSDFSSGGGYNRYNFREDRKNRLFQLGGATPDVVVLKYVSTGIDATGDINIPRYATRALEAWVRFCIADYDDYPESTILRLKKQYDERRKEMRRAHRPTLQDLKDAIWASTGVIRR